MNSTVDNSSPAIQVEQVRKVFGTAGEAFTALDDVSLEINSNEFFTLLGPSGCGKTTLLRLIAGFEFPTKGSIRLDNLDIAEDPPYRRPVNTVFQNYALFPHMSVEQNIAFGLEMLGKQRSEIKARVAEVLDLVQMGALAKRATSEISGGQQQRVALARALAPSPKVLLLDEPLSALDYQLRKEMQIELKRMQHETGITFVFVTHDQEEALTMSDRIAVMSAGRILQVGTPHAIYEQPANRFVASFIGESNFLSGHIEPDSSSSDSRLVRLASGQSVIAECEADCPTDGPCELVVRPEHARLLDASEASNAPVNSNESGVTYLLAQLTNVVYSGTDTQHHLRLGDGSAFIVRRQNTRNQTHSEHTTGSSVWLEIEPCAARVLSQDS